MKLKRLLKDVSRNKNIDLLYEDLPTELVGTEDTLYSGLQVQSALLKEEQDRILDSKRYEERRAEQKEQIQELREQADSEITVLTDLLNNMKSTELGSFLNKKIKSNQVLDKVQSIHSLSSLFKV